MGLNVADVFELHAGVGHCCPHGVGQGHVAMGRQFAIRNRGAAEPDNFAIDLDAASLGGAQLLEDDHARAFAQHHAAAVQIERPAGFGRYEFRIGQFFLLPGVATAFIG